MQFRWVLEEGTAFESGNCEYTPVHDKKGNIDRPQRDGGNDSFEFQRNDVILYPIICVRMKGVCV